MLEKVNYNIGNDECDKPRSRFHFEWYDEFGEYHIHETMVMEEAQIIMSLLSGESCLADYEEDKNN